MRSRNLLVAAVLLAALSGVVWWAKRHPSTGETTNTPASPKMADIPAAQIKQIVLKKKDGATLALASENGKWTITDPSDVRADQDAVTSLASTLSPVTADNVVEDKPANLAQYGLTTPSLTVTVTERNGKTDKLIFGDDVPAGDRKSVV